MRFLQRSIGAFGQRQDGRRAGGSGGAGLTCGRPTPTGAAPGCVARRIAALPQVEECPRQP
jgi:hypothetical protein